MTHFPTADALDDARMSDKVTQAHHTVLPTKRDSLRQGTTHTSNRARISARINALGSAPDLEHGLMRA